MNGNSFLFSGGIRFVHCHRMYHNNLYDFSIFICIMIFWSLDRNRCFECAKPFSREKCYSHCLTHISTRRKNVRGKNVQNNGSILRVISINFLFSLTLSLPLTRSFLAYWKIENWHAACNKEIISGLLAWSSSSSLTNVKAWLLHKRRMNTLCLA